MKTDVFKFCEHNLEKKESYKAEHIREERNASMEFLLTMTFLAGCITMLGIFIVCKSFGLF